MVKRKMGLSYHGSAGLSNIPERGQAKRARSRASLTFGSLCDSEKGKIGKVRWEGRSRLGAGCNRMST